MTGPRRNALISFGVLLLAGGLRWLASRDDLWLDEIWSWGHVQHRVKSAWDILFTLRHDNNHLLNSWWIYLLGPDADRLWYRLPPIVCGSLTVLLARQTVASSGPVAVWAVTILTLPSYLLIHYSSEARGYGYELCFCLAAYVVLERLLKKDWPKSPQGLPDDRRGIIDRGLFAACCVAGGLSHPAFFMMFLAFGVWAIWATVRARKPWSDAVRWLLSVFLVPACLLLQLWFINYSRMTIGGGPPETPWLVALSTAALMVGGPEFGDASLAIGLLVLFAVGVQLLHLARSGEDRWVCAAAMIVIPAAVLFLTGSRLIYPRYLLGTVVVLLPALAQLTARCFEQGIVGRSVAIGLLSATLVGNGWQTARLITLGRGQGQSVVEFLRDETPAGPILIGSDQLFRHGLVLDYFGTRLKIKERLVHFGTDRWPPRGPRWILFHSQDRVWTPPPAYTDPRGNRYELRRVFPYAALSGWHTAVYQNANPQLERGT